VAADLDIIFIGDFYYERKYVVWVGWGMLAVLHPLFTLEFAFFFLPWRNSPIWPRSPHYRGFAIKLKHTTLGTTPLDE